MIKAIENLEKISAALMKEDKSFIWLPVQWH